MGERLKGAVPIIVNRNGDLSDPIHECRKTSPQTHQFHFTNLTETLINPRSKLLYFVRYTSIEVGKLSIHSC